MLIPHIILLFLKIHVTVSRKLEIKVNTIIRLHVALLQCNYQARRCMDPQYTTQVRKMPKFITKIRITLHAKVSKKRQAKGKSKIQAVVKIQGKTIR